MKISHLVFLFAVFVGEQRSGSGSVDYAISHAVKDSTELSMTKKIHDGNVETSITAEKGSSFDKKVVDFWQKDGYFQQQPCNFKLDKANMPEMTIFYVNQAS